VTFGGASTLIATVLVSLRLGVPPSVTTTENT